MVFECQAVGDGFLPWRDVEGIFTLHRRGKGVRCESRVGFFVRIGGQGETLGEDADGRVGGGS